MHRFLILISLLFFSAQLLFSQPGDSIVSRRYHELSASWDNDALMNTDYYYTQGLMTQIVLPCLEKNPINHLFFHIKNARNYFGFAVAQEMFTPINIEDTLIISNDRPYAGVLYVRSLKVSNCQGVRLKFTSEFDLGILGSASGAGYVQKTIHEINGLIPPNGWSYQIQNMPYINYNVMIDKGIAESPGFSELLYSAKARIGTIYDDIQFGLKVRTGLINSYFDGVTIQDRSLNSHRDIQAYFYGGASGKAVLYNTLLTGGMFSSGNPHVLNYDEMSHFVYSCNMGIFLAYKGVGAKFEFFGQSPEFAGGLYHGWFTTAAVISFY